MLQIVLTTTPFAKVILLILLIFSILSWAIIIGKWGFFRRVQRANQTFSSRFHTRTSLFQPLGQGGEPLLGRFRDSPLPGLQSAALEEWHRTTGRDGGIPLNSESTEPLLQVVSEAMNRRISKEVDRYESQLSFLATAGGASPFLGLLGTVWGIMKSFIDIRGLPAVNLQVVAPGIADALIVTAAGLFVAIPAVIYYNHFLGRIRSLTATMERFASEVTSELRLEFLRRHTTRSVE